jgi:pre-mRNA-processing factor SLU7
MGWVGFTSCADKLCCHSTIKQSYCVGAGGKGAAADAAQQLAVNMEAKAAEDEERRKESKLVGHKPAADVWGEAGEDLQLDPAKVAEALARQQQHEKEGREAEERDDRKRKYNSLAGQDVEVTPEEMEAHRLRKQRADDPLSFIDREKEKLKGGDGYDYV